MESILQSPCNEKATRSLVMMRGIASSITFEFRKREWTQARLLTQPLDRYAAPDHSITNKAIFACGESNDLDVFLHVWHEVSEEWPLGKWYWLAAMSTSLPLYLQREDNVLREKPGYWSSARAPSSSCVETLVGLHSDLVDPKFHK